MKTYGSDELAFLAAIHAAPRDDAPRLVYADWLDEHGEPEYAEFIRLQCQRPYVAIDTRDPRRPGGSIRYALDRDDYSASKAREARMIELFPIVARSCRNEQLMRWDFKERARGLPVLQISTIDGEPPESGFLSDVGPLPRIDLYLRSDISARWLSEPYMQRVDRLCISPDIALGNWHDYKDLFWEEMLPRLAESPVIDRLEELRPCGCDSNHTMEMATRMLGPRVHIEFNY